jgi:flavin reductase (DIM6/NTAB) family NADH-FMN oxidoreductase RutF
VAVVTARRPDGHCCGLTANAVTSLSLDPPLVLVCVERSSETHGCILESGHLAVSMLRHDQERLARRFAEYEAGDKFEGVAYRAERTGAPVLEDALAWLDCRLWRTYEGGDHTIFVAEVLAGDAREGVPLVYYRSGFGRVTP